MKLRIEAESEDEVRGKAPELLVRLAKALRAHAPEVADELEKASLKGTEHPLKHEALRDGFAEVRKRYQQQLDMMLAEIGRALDEHVDEMKKSASPDYTVGVVRLEDAAYDKVKEQLATFGFNDADFEDADGKLYGFSTGELRDLLKQLNAQRAG